MIDERTSRQIARVSERIGARGRSHRQHILFRLSIAGYCSLVGLLFAWVATVLLLSGAPNWAIVAMFGGFAFDKLDGYIAREHGYKSDLGRDVDAFLDVFVYLVTGSVLFQTTMSPHPVVGVAVGFLIIAFGGLRLLRFTDEGFVVVDGTSYYRGTTVVHTNLLVLCNYVLVLFVDPWNGWLAGATIGVACPLMLSNYLSEKTVKSQAIVAALSVGVSCLCVALAVGVM